MPTRIIGSSVQVLLQAVPATLICVTHTTGVFPGSRFDRFSRLPSSFTKRLGDDHTIRKPQQKHKRRPSEPVLAGALVHGPEL
jgi:hypothetical protein